METALQTGQRRFHPCSGAAVCRARAHTHGNAHGGWNARGKGDREPAVEAACLQKWMAQADLHLEQIYIHDVTDEGGAKHARVGLDCPPCSRLQIVSSPLFSCPPSLSRTEPSLSLCASMEKPAENNQHERAISSQPACEGYTMSPCFLDEGMFRWMVHIVKKAQAELDSAQPSG